MKPWKLVLSLFAVTTLAAILVGLSVSPVEAQRRKPVRPTNAIEWVVWTISTWWHERHR